MRFPVIPQIIAVLAASPILPAHPIPDIPVRGEFGDDGKAAIRVEVDPRCFETDWELENYLLKIQMDKLMSPAECVALKMKAQEFVARGIEFFFEPQGAFAPDFQWEFTTLGGGPLVNIDDPVIVTGTWRGAIPAGLRSYAVRATEAIQFAVVFSNTLRGKAVERTAVLFPGEKSFSLQMDGSNATQASAPPPTTDASVQDGPSDPPALPTATWWKGAALLAAALAALWLARIRSA